MSGFGNIIIIIINNEGQALCVQWSHWRLEWERPVAAQSNGEPGAAPLRPKRPSSSRLCSLLPLTVGDCHALPRLLPPSRRPHLVHLRSFLLFFFKFFGKFYMHSKCLLKFRNERESSFVFVPVRFALKVDNFLPRVLVLREISQDIKA